MNRLLIASALSSALLLSSCATVPGVDPITGTSMTTEVNAAIAKAIQICGYQPTFATVTNIIATFIPGASPISAIADQVGRAVCSAVTAKGARYGGAAPQVNGVPINGHFVQRARHGR